MTDAREREERVASRIEAVVAGSRVMSSLSTWLAAPARAGQDAQAGRLLAPFLQLDLTGRLRASGWVVIVAVITHATVLAAFRVPMHVLGWSASVVMIALGLFLARRPAALATAWADKAGDAPRSH